MKAMIFAAGEGRRMRPLTLETPKPLLTVHDKPLIVYHLERLALAGVTDVVINVSYLGDKIMSALGNGQQFGVHIEYSKEAEPLETGGALKQALPLLGDTPFILVNADVWTDYPYEQLLQTEKPLSGAHLVLVDNPSHNPHGDFTLNENGVITGFGQGKTFSGVSVIHPKLISQFQANALKFPLRDLLIQAMNNENLFGEFYSGQWHDIGTPERLLSVSKLVEGLVK